MLVEQAGDRSGNRDITRVIRGVPASDGAGVRLTRIIGSRELDHLDPFLLLDAFESDNPDDYVAGFPDHPHRGFETVTYLLAGRMRHEDNTGHAGVIEAGGVQWMTAGRGIVHSEMPEQENGLLKGFQLWVNLPARLKMTEPRYREFSADAIPIERRETGAQARVITGTTSQGTTGPVRDVTTDPLYLDIELPQSGSFIEPIELDHNAFLYVINGTAAVVGQEDEKEVGAQTLAVLGRGERVHIVGQSRGNRMLLVAGRRLNEPIARGGPFVMNTKQEVVQAFRDFQEGRF